MSLPAILTVFAFLLPPGGPVLNHLSPIKPVLVWQGTNGKQEKELFARCTSQAEFESIWNGNFGKGADKFEHPCPEVDFNQYMVVAIFPGQAWSDDPIAMVEIVKDLNCIRLRWRHGAAQTIFTREVNQRTGETEVNVFSSLRGVVDLNRSPSGFGYAFILLPKSDKPVVIEQDLQNWIGKPPVWKERAKFPSLPAKRALGAEKP